MNEDEFRNAPKKNGVVILPAVQMPIDAMKMKISTPNGMLLIELEKTVNYLQFNKRDAITFIKGLIPIVNSMSVMAFLIVVGLTSPARADESYDSGYNAGYYSGAAPQSEGSSYGRGYDDGVYDADQEDERARQTSEDFESALVQEQTREYEQYRGASKN